MSHVTLRLHIWRQVYKEPYGTAAIFNISPRHTSAVTCFFLSGQQVKVKLTHHQLQAGSRLKGLSLVIIAISKKAAPAYRTRFREFTTFTASKCKCLMSTLLFIQKAAEKKGGSSVSHSEKIYDSKVWTEYRCWNKKAWQSCLFFTSQKEQAESVHGNGKHQLWPFSLYLCLPVTIHLNIIAHLCT